MALDINIVGTGGIIEGDLGAANVNVNLDAALHFDGNGDYIDLGDLTVLDGEGSFTIATWVNFDSDSGDDQRFLWKTDSFGLGYFAGQLRGYIYYSGGDTNAQASHSVKGKGWKHVAMTYDGTTVRLFINGAEAATASVSSKTLANSGNNLRLGGSGSSNEYLKGNMADVRLYSSVLDPDTEIPVLASKIGVDNAVVQSSDTRVGHWMLTATDSGSDLTSFVGGSSSTVTLPVTDGDDFIDNDYQRILVENEVLRITGISGNNLTVATRSGADLHGTTLEDLSDDADVYIIGLEDLSTNNNSPVLYGNLTTPSTNLDFDAFSVNVQDNSTTTDGTFTVTQGKLECLSLSSLDFSGDTQLVTCTSNTFYNSKTAFSVSAWFNHDNSHDGHLLHTIVNARDGGNDGMALSLDSTNDRIRFRIGDGSSDDLYTGNSTITNGQWHHVVATRDASNNTAIYIDGVSVVTGSSSKTISITSALGIGGRPSATDADEFSGRIRDVKCWDYTLSTDQIASLYSGSYNVTPEHWYKLDDNGLHTVGGNNYDDAGIASTPRDGTRTGATDSKGTLNLDGTLTIAANGTLSAPRGTLDLAGNYTGAAGATYTHNSGLLHLSNGNDLNYGSTVGPFYDLRVTGDNEIRVLAMTIENNFTVDSGGTTGISYNGDIVWTMGKSTATTVAEGGSITSTGTVRINNTGSGQSFAVQGASTLYPCIITGTDFDWDYGSAASHTKFGNVDYQISTLALGTTSGVKLTLTGDCEFDAVTVAANTTLDLNGQRIHTTGTVSGAGTINMGAGMWDCDGVMNASGFAFTEEEGATFLFDGANNYIHVTDQSFVGDANTNILIQGTNNTYFNPITDGAPDAPTYVGNVIVGSGTSSWPGPDGDTYSKSQGKNITIATGGTVTPTGTTPEVTCLGDFTTSGGLLGPSCLELNGSDEYAYNSGTTWGFGDAWTVEMWFKTSTDAQMTMFDLHNDSNSNNRVRLLVKAGDDYVYLQTFNSSGTENTISAPIDVIDGKWHHVAATSSGTVLQIYIDGKLMKQSTITVDRDSDPTMRLRIGRLHTSAIEYWNGCIDELRIWNAVRTQTEIRDNMFKSGYSNLSNNGGLMAAYDFDAGTGSDVNNANASSEVGARDLSLNDAGGAETAGLWAGAGTFNISSDPTLIMSGTGTMTIPHGFDLHNLTAAASGQTTTVTVPAANNDLDIEGLLTLGGGTFTDSSTNLDLLLKGTSTPVMGGSTFANINRVIYNANDTIIAGTTYDTLISNGTGQTLGGTTIATTTTIDSASSSVLSTNGYNLTTTTVSAESGTTLDVDKASSLIFTDASGCGFGSSSGTLNCKGDAAALFDGASDKISVANGASIQNLETFSYSFWVKQPVRARENIIYKGTNVQLEITADGAITAFRRYNTSNDVATTSTTLTADTWYHIVWLASSDGSTAPDIYINGSEASYASNTSGTGSSTDDSGSALTIGLGAGGVTDFEGSIADFRIYKDKILTASEIATLYNSGSNPAINGGNTFADPDNDLGATDWWKLNESNFPTDNAANSAGSTVGTVTGAKSNRITVTSSGTPTNYWNFYDHTLDITADYTTFEKFHRYESGGSSTTIDIDNCTIRNSLTNYYNWTIESNATITSFTNNSIAVVGNYGFQNNKAHTAFDNITITGGSDRDVISSVKSEFTNSNFDITKVVLSNTSSHVISKTHNDTENLYEMVLGSAGQSYSAISNKPDIPTGVLRQRSGLLIFNSDNKEFDSLNVFTGATIRVSDTKDMYLTTFDNDGTWDQATAGYTTGEIHVGDYTPFDSEDVIDNTEFVDTGFHDVSHFLEMDL